MLNALILILSTSYLAWYLERFEIAMIYPFDATYATPEAAGEPRLAETRFATADGESLVVWRAAAAPGKPTVLYLPGNAGTLRDRADRFHRLIDRGYGVVALAYRGSSGSTGSPDEEHLTSDVRALASGERERPLVLYGESLGTALAVKIAAEGLGDAVILEAPFTSIPDLLTAQYPQESLAGLVTQKWDSLQGVREVRQPLLILHGTDDRLVPLAMGRRIFEAAGSTEKSFVELSERGHSGSWTEPMQAAMFAFLESRGN